MVEIVQIQTKKEESLFINFPNNLYDNCQYYVPELNISVRSKLSKEHPFYDKSEVALFLAHNDNTVVGRIAAIYNGTHLDVYQDNTGFFGYLDAVDDEHIFKMLFEAAETWLKNKGIERIIGPTNLTTNHESGVLIEGFDHQNLINMPYNYSYYKDHINAYGYQKGMDLYSYLIDKPPNFELFDLVQKRTERQMQGLNIKIRPISLSRFDQEIDQLCEVYNECNEDNWGFLPLNKDEFRLMAKELKTIMPTDLCLLAYKENELIGYVVAVPDINSIISTFRSSKLNLFRLIKMMYYKNKLSSGRVMLIGVKKDNRHVGIDLLLFRMITENLLRNGFTKIEACYVLESNKVMRKLAQKLGGRVVKKYRLYSKNLLN